MFKSIRNLFSRSAVVNNEQEFTEIVWNAPYDGEFHKYPDGESPCLSQAELQMLQRIVAKEIYLESECQKLDKIDAISHPKGSYSRDVFFNSARKRGAKLKKLSALQYRLKHKIAAKG